MKGVVWWAEGFILGFRACCLGLQGSGFIVCALFLVVLRACMVCWFVSVLVLFVSFCWLVFLVCLLLLLLLLPQLLLLRGGGGSGGNCGGRGGRYVSFGVHMGHTSQGWVKCCIKLQGGIPTSSPLYVCSFPENTVWT